MPRAARGAAAAASDAAAPPSSRLWDEAHVHLAAAGEDRLCRQEPALRPEGKWCPRRVSGRGEDKATMEPPEQEASLTAEGVFVEEKTGGSSPGDR